MAGYYDARLLDNLAGAAVARISEFTEQGLGSLSWAYSKLGHHHQGLLEAIARQASSMGYVSSNCPVMLCTEHTARPC